jgi:hypothetical protein
MRKTKSTAAPISLEAVEILIDEVLSEGAKYYARILEKLRRTTPGTQRHRDLLIELSVAAGVIAIKSQTAEEAIEEYLDATAQDD